MGEQEKEREKEKSVYKYRYTILYVQNFLNWTRAPYLAVKYKSIRKVRVDSRHFNGLLFLNFNVQFIHGATASSAAVLQQNILRLILIYRGVYVCIYDAMTMQPKIIIKKDNCWCFPLVLPEQWGTSASRFV